MTDARSLPTQLAPEGMTPIEAALHLDRIYGWVEAYPQISEVPNAAKATRAEVFAGYERVRANTNLHWSVVMGEKAARDIFAGTLAVLEETVVAERDRYRQALIPFAFIGRDSMEPLGLAEEYDEARRLLGLETASTEGGPQHG